MIEKELYDKIKHILTEYYKYTKTNVVTINIDWEVSQAFDTSKNEISDVRVINNIEMLSKRFMNDD